MTTPWQWQQAAIVDYNTYKLTKVNLLNASPLSSSTPNEKHRQAGNDRVKTLICNKSNKVDEDAIRLDLGLRLRLRLGLVCRCSLVGVVNKLNFRHAVNRGRISMLRSGAER